MSRNNEFTVCAVLVAIAFIVGSMIGATSTQNSWRMDAASTECAQFNPLTGHFEWLTDES
jgi:hypothetical protein